MNAPTLDRRSFLISTAVVGGGLALSLIPGGASAAEAAAGEAEISPWLVIRPDDVVIVRAPTPEIGNGASTQIAMNVAEELACDWSKVQLESASIRRDVLENGVYSFGFLPFFSGHGAEIHRMTRTLQAGASARERLRAAAAARWKVPVSEIEAKNSVLTHLPTGRTLRYGEVAAAAASVQLAAEPALKSPADWTFLGKASPPKLNAPMIADGSAVYGIDVQLPGMVHAAIRQSPVQGGKLKSFDASAVLKMPGVKAVVAVDPAKTKGSPVEQKSTFGLASSYAQSAVVVIADHFWQAKTALDKLPVEWDPGPGAGKTHQDIYDAARADLDQTGKPDVLIGDPASVTAATTLEATYSTPFCDSAPMEPLNATVLYTPDRLEIWHPGQDQQQCFWVAIDESGLPPEKVFYHQTLVGGGFGRRTQGDDLRMVVAVARQYPGVPVKVIWTREETTRQGRYRHPVITRFKAALAQDGTLAALDAQSRVTGQQPSFGFGLLDAAYVLGGGIPNVRMELTRPASYMLTGAYRAPNYNSHAFMLESFIDECAHAAKIDPLAYRLRMLTKWDPAWSACLNIAAEKSGWGQPLPKGEGRGIAISAWHNFGKPLAGTVICAVAHVAVTQKGVLSVKRLDYTFDCGRVVNRDAVAAQIEGGALFGMNSALNEEITLQDGAVVEGNFNTYPILRSADAPEVYVHFEALSGNDRYDIIGEAPVGPVQPAIANAIFQATGKRLRTTPFRKQDLSWT